MGTHTNSPSMSWRLEENGRMHQDGGEALFGNKRLAIMLVDDDCGVVEIVAALLRVHLDAEVAVFDLPIAALETFSSDPNRWSAVVTDFHMPGMTGAELAGWLRRCRADVPVVVISGAANVHDACGGLSQPVEFVQKPFIGMPLIEAIEAVTRCPALAA